jgi:hypothetical protein
MEAKNKKQPSQNFISTSPKSSDERELRAAMFGRAEMRRSALALKHAQNARLPQSSRINLEIWAKV